MKLYIILKIFFFKWFMSNEVVMLSYKRKLLQIRLLFVMTMKWEYFFTWTLTGSQSQVKTNNAYLELDLSPVVFEQRFCWSSEGICLILSSALKVWGLSGLCCVSLPVRTSNILIPTLVTSKPKSTSEFPNTATYVRQATN